MKQPKRERISKRELQWLEHLLACGNAREAGRKIGLTARQAKRTAAWVMQKREDSSKPYLWDIWRAKLDDQLRILGAEPSAILRELAIIAFSSIDRFVELPSRTPDEVTGEKRETICVKYIEDIPKELIPAIAEIHETKEGIRVKLHSKLDALDKLARHVKLFNTEPQEENPFSGDINIHVNGSKSPMLLKISQEQQSEEKKK